MCKSVRKPLVTEIAEFPAWFLITSVRCLAELLLRVGERL